MHIDSTSRFVQFASYNFDASIVEMLSTLMVGGTICIVDDIARLDTIAFGLAMRQMRASVALLTASFINALDEQALEGLTTLIQGGEALPKSIVQKWAPKLQLQNAYGQVEASVVSTCTATLSQDSDGRNIGKPVTGRCWVIDPDDPAILLSPGQIGELLVEGPHVGRGYLGQPEKTDAVFITRPIWHEDLFPEEQDPRTLRFYRTGDLVIQEQDGNFTYQGRKDEQVKLNGQRIELGEIEHQFRCALQPLRDITVELVKTKTGNTALVAFVSMGTDYTKDAVAAQKLLDREMTVTEKKVRQILPYFMIPASYFAVESIPISINGKVDRKKLRALGEVRLQKRSSLPSVGSDERGWSDVEKTLREIWCRVLNVSEEVVGRASVFQSLGGDSITAMQVVSQAASKGLSMTVQDIMQRKTIEKIAPDVARNARNNSSQSIQENLDDEVEVNMPFKLSPVQKFFFQLSPNGENHDNISFLFHLKRPISLDELHVALEAIVIRHPMLRARFFEMKRGHWLQYVSDDIRGSFCGSSHQVDDMSQLKLVIAKLQRTLDIRDGPLLRGDLVSVAESSKTFLFLSAHHLVTDFVSLRVILHCLEQHLQARPTNSPEAISFPKWCYEQESFFRTYPTKNMSCAVPEPDLEFWGMKGRQNVYGDSITESLSLDTELSTTLLAKASNTSLETEFVDALLSGVIHAFKQTFFDRRLPAFFVEGHGREPFWNDSIDLSLTVGWFTTIAPIVLGDDQAKDLIGAMRAVRDVRTALVGKGLGHFASQHYQKGQRTEPPSSMEIIFNYAGIFQQLEKEDALLQQVPGFNIMNMDAFGEGLPRWGLVEILGNVVNGCIQLSFTFNKNMHHQDRIRSWMQECQYSFDAMATRLTQMCHTFPLLDASVEQTSKLEVNILPGLHIDLEDVEDIYPCSPMQHGMLLSQISGRATYTSELFLEITSKAEEIDINHLEKVWSSLVNRHAVFRTIFIESVRGDGSFDQVVLRNIRPSISRLLDDIEKQPTSKWVAGQPQHHLWIRQVSSKRVDLRLDISHVLIDGSSISTLKDDLQRGYDSIEVLDSIPRPLYSNYIRRLGGLSHAASVHYWMQYLSDVEPCQFPQLSNTQESHLAFADVPGIDYEKILGFCRCHGITVSDLLKTIWAFVLHCYTGCENPVFGYLSSNRTEADDGAIGVYTNIQLSAVKMTPTATVLDIIEKVQADGIDQMKHRECPLVDVMHAMSDVPREGLCNTAMSLQKVPTEENNNGISIHVRREKDVSEFDLTFVGYVSDKSIELAIQYWTTRLSTAQASRVVATVSKIIDSVLGSPYSNLSEVDMISSRDLSSLLQWNERPSKDFVVDECIHEIFERIAQEHPEHIAVRAWDGTVTYGQLNHLSTKLACHLRKDKLSGPEDIIPIFMEKSVWAIVSMLAVLKVGAAFTPLSPEAPLDHILTLLDKISARYVITSPGLLHKLKNHIPQVIVSQQLMNNLHVRHHQRNTASPANLAYVLFTSGSTGHPKGVMVQHSHFLASSIRYCPILELDSASRVLQFSAYTFDMSILEIWSTLTSGGCVCQMSEEQRKNDIIGAIKSFGVNTLTLTPTVLGLIDPQEVPHMRTVAIGGEIIPKGLVETWAPVTNLIEIYGPTETSVLATAQTGLNVDSNRLCIGKSFCCNAFVVNAETGRLMPVGAIGELWLEGPSVTRGYLKDEAQTANAFVWQRNWFKPNTQSRFYRTGDLVRYNEDGSLDIYGRKDRQVKVRGQRFELSELEHQAASLLGIKATSVAAEMVNSKLVLFIEAQDASPEQVQASMTALEHQLPKKLSLAMSSPILLPISNRFPYTSSGKLDRKLLRAKATEFISAEESLPANQHTSNTLIAKTQERLHSLLAKVLGIQSSQIQPHDNFFHMGGDSYLAMQLVVAARDDGFQLSVASILRNPILSDLVEIVKHNINHNDEPEMSPFALVSNLDVNELKREAMAACLLTSTDDIEDIYPVTPIQEAFVIESLKSPTAYVGQHVIEFTGSLSAKESDRIRDAWKSCVEENPILRTRIFQTLTTHPPRALQVVLRECKAELGFANGLDAYLKSHEAWAVGYGKSLHHAAIVIDHNKTYLVWSAHHCLYDAISLKLLLERLYNIAGSSKGTALVPFSKYVEYTEKVKKSDTTAQFWSTYLANSTTTTFPRIQRNTMDSKKTCEEFRLDKSLKGGPSGVTPATVLHVAWGLLLSAYNGLATDVTFGSIMSGRSSPLRGVEGIIGPTIVALPLRVRFEPATQIDDLLARMQEQSVAMIPHQALGLQNIQSLSLDTSRACSFSTLFVVQQAQEEDLPLKVTSRATNISNSYSYAINIVCSLLGDQTVAVSVIYDTVVLDSFEVHQMMRHFDEILGQVLDSRNRSRAVEDLIRPIVKLAPEQPIDGPLLVDMAPGKPSAEMLHHLQLLWAECLGIDQSRDIDIYDNFLKLGGNSITAMQLSGIARREGFSLQVVDILQRPIFCEMASRMAIMGLKAGSAEVPVFSLLADGLPLNHYLELAASDARIQVDDIEDMYPCTPLQEGLMASSSKGAGSYVMQLVFDLQPRTLDRFKRAWESIVRTYDILRTRIVDLGDAGLFQVVLKPSKTTVDWQSSTDLDGYITNDLQNPMSLGDPLVRYAIVVAADGVRFVWTAHHAVYDRTTVAIISAALDKALSGAPIQQPPRFTRLIEYLSTRDPEESNRFWETYLAGVKLVPFPLPQKLDDKPRADKVVSRLVSFDRKSSKFTISTILQAAWGLVLARHSNCDDVVFGLTQSGRLIAVHEVDKIPGPAVVTVPVRIRLGNQESLLALLEDVQSSNTASIPHYHHGLQNISCISDSAKQACDFRTLLSIYPKEYNSGTEFNLLEGKISSNNAAGFHSFPLLIDCEFTPSSVLLICTHDERFITTHQVQSMLQQWEYAIKQLITIDNETQLTAVSDMSLLESEDYSLLGRWATSPGTLQHFETASSAWIIDSQDHNRLAPIGVVGEVVLGRIEDIPAAESPTKRPTWCQKVDKAPLELLYTGKLARFADHGSLELLGEKNDMPVMQGGQYIVYGAQRLICQALRERGAAVQAIELVNHPTDGFLVGIVELEHCHREDGGYQQLLEGVFAAIRDNLHGVLPSFVIPRQLILRSLFLQTSPTNSNLQHQGLSSISLSPDTPMEKPSDEGIISPVGDRRGEASQMTQVLLSLCQRILGLKTVDVRKSFIKLGGDSLSAMKLVTAARREGITITVKNIFDYPMIPDLAQVAKPSRVDQPSSGSIAPFSMLDGNAHDIINEAARACNVNPGIVEDAYPCTAMQDGLMALSSMEQGAYVAEYIIRVPDNKKSQSAWRQLVSLTPILRTRIVQTQRWGNFQVVLREEASITVGDNVDKYISTARREKMSHGKRLVHAGFIYDGSNSYLVILIHHAIFDGWAWSIMMRHLQQLYRGEFLTPSPQYSSFVNYTLRTQAMESTESFWRSYLDKAESIIFPPTPTHNLLQPQLNTHKSRRFNLGAGDSFGYTTTSMIQTAWALLVGRYSSSKDVTIGVVLSGRTVPVHGIEDMIGPTLTTIPMRFKIGQADRVVELLQNAQDMNVHPAQHFGVQRIKQLSPGAQAACNFTSALIVQPVDTDEADETNLFQLMGDSKLASTYTGYNLVLHCQILAGGDINATILFDSAVLEEGQATRLLGQMNCLLKQLSSQPTQQISQLEYVSTEDKTEISTSMQSDLRLDSVPCLHEIVEAHAHNQPSALAVSSWDGDFTYKELDQLATQLAHHLTASLNVEKGDAVPLCFHKSKWTQVAMLGVLKAGACFVLLDPDYPTDRLQSICRKVNASVALVSAGLDSHLSEVVRTSFVLDHDFKATIPLTTKSTAYDPNQPAYVSTTSGTTGVPKACVISHASIVRSALSLAEVAEVSSTTRAMQFASYSFDVCIIETLMVWVSGGCTCVLSEEERKNNIGGAVAALSCNWAVMTPSVARLLSPDAIPEVKTFFIGGEALTTDILETWAGKVNLFQGYGPCECTPVALVSATPMDIKTDPRDIGIPIPGVSIWVVDPDDRESLAPLGAVGELLIEGPTVGSGYIDDSNRNNAFIGDAPAWRHEFPGTCQRMYMTGDLVQWSNQGTLLFIGRKDTQVKLNGQRLELADIEHHLKAAMAKPSDLAVELITSEDDTSAPIIAAFITIDGTNISVGEDGTENHWLAESEETNKRLAEALGDAKQQLAHTLPSYMVPRIFIPVKSLPLSIAGKVDRKLLRSIGSAAKASYIESSTRSNTYLPATSMERTLKSLWMKTLNVSSDMVHPEADFFGLGGDSLLAMRLAAQARESGVDLQTAEIVRNPTFMGMASKCKPRNKIRPISEFKPFSSLPKDVDTDSLLRNTIGIPRGDVEDIIEATSLQKMMATVSTLPTHGIVNHLWLDFEVPVDVGRLREACVAVVNHHSILRTVFVPYQDKLWQIVHRAHVPEFGEIYEADDIGNATANILESNKSQGQALGKPGLRFDVVQGYNSKAERSLRLIIRIPHSLYDGISLPIILDHLRLAYSKLELPITPSFSTYLAALRRLQANSPAAEAFWKQTLLGSSITPVVSATSEVTSPHANELNGHLVDYIHVPDATARFDTILHTAWALVLASFTGERDVVFGRIVANRSVPIPNASSIVGPCFNMIPMRISPASNQTCEQLLGEVEQQRRESISYEYVELDHIVEHCTDWPRDVRFGSVIVYNDFEAAKAFEHGNFTMFGEARCNIGFKTMPPDMADILITAIPVLQEGRVRIDIGFSEAVIKPESVQEMLDSLCRTVEQLCMKDVQEKSVGVLLNNP
ncbi:hypothetical protein F5X96DRAFT_411126 [Biscogniauxia mediterranea]|nr:hypothetical protein F5X96DRAFT_411126 [Biscogniauxia mediterranea]